MYHLLYHLLLLVQDLLPKSAGEHSAATFGEHFAAKLVGIVCCYAKSSSKGWRASLQKLPCSGATVASRMLCCVIRMSRYTVTVTDTGYLLRHLYVL
jgi:hypothetical protein